MSRNLVWVAVVIAAALLETTWLQSLRLAGAIPNLTVLLVVYYALVESEERAMMTGVIGGVFQDVANDSVLGHHVLGLAILGYVFGRLSTRLVTEHPAVKAGLVFAGCLAAGLIYTVVYYVQHPGMLAFQHFFNGVMPSAFYTALTTPMVFWVLERGLGGFLPQPTGTP